MAFSKKLFLRNRTMLVTKKLFYFNFSNGVILKLHMVDSSSKIITTVTLIRCNERILAKLCSNFEMLRTFRRAQRKSQTAFNVKNYLCNCGT